ncbi:phage tail assembly protein [Acutalibacter muris]|uniref:phage tail assembly protein n=1 Tax=Acutalibacter muris TaxID=1796620 RepID=UPI001C3EA7C0|nr:phage tail assembly protein [Acutalibacter muris]
MSDSTKNIAGNGAEQATDAAEAVTREITPPAEEKPAGGDVGVYTHTFKRPFEYSGVTYTELTFNFERLTGRDMVSIETEMQMNNEYALAPEISRNFQSKMAAKAAGIGSDVMDAMPLPEFNRITNAARDFLLSTGY